MLNFLQKFACYKFYLYLRGTLTIKKKIMILQNMNSIEKLGQMSRILEILENRVDSFIGRNQSNLRRKLKTADRIVVHKPFSLGANGKWDVDMYILKVSKDYVKVNFDACMKYFINSG